MDGLTGGGVETERLSLHTDGFTPLARSGRGGQGGGRNTATNGGIGDRG